MGEPSPSDISPIILSFTGYGDLSCSARIHTFIFPCQIWKGTVYLQLVRWLPLSEVVSQVWVYMSAGEQPTPQGACF